MAILLCSANESVRHRWQGFLAGLYEVYQAASLSNLHSQCVAHGIDLLLLHRTLVDMDTTAAIHRAEPKRKIFLLSDRPDEDEGLAFLKLGVVGYANTYISPRRLVEAVRIISSGSVWIGQRLMQRLIRETMPQKMEDVPPSSPKLAGMTSREREIAELIAQGQSNLEIAANLEITERTVKAHLSSIYSKTGTGSRLNLALLINREMAARFAAISGHR